MDLEHQKTENTVSTSKESNYQFIALDKLHTFKFHVFKPKEDERMDKIVESVKLNGIIHPHCCTSDCRQ